MSSVLSPSYAALFAYIFACLFSPCALTNRTPGRVSTVPAYFSEASYSKGMKNAWKLSELSETYMLLYYNNRILSDLYFLHR